MGVREWAAPRKDVPSFWYRCHVLTPVYSNPGPDQQTDRGPGFRLLLFNARLINNKDPLICDLISEEQPTWHVLPRPGRPRGAEFPSLKCAWPGLGYGTCPRPQGRRRTGTVVFWKSCWSSGVLLHKLLVVRLFLKTGWQDQLVQTVVARAY